MSKSGSAQLQGACRLPSPVRDLLWRTNPGTKGTALIAWRTDANGTTLRRVATSAVTYLGAVFLAMAAALGPA
jgi:hypothetical protein